MTETLETWSSMSCRPETWPQETTTATLTPLSRSTSYLGEGELWTLNLRECLVCVSLSASVSVLFPLPYFFLTLYWLRCLELTNYLSVYERMRMDMMTWGSHLSLIWFTLHESMDVWFRYHTKQWEGITMCQNTWSETDYICAHIFHYKFLILCTAPQYYVASFLLSSCQLYCLSMSLWVTRARINTSLSCSVTVSALR